MKTIFPDEDDLPDSISENQIIKLCKKRLSFILNLFIIYFIY